MGRELLCLKEVHKRLGKRVILSSVSLSLGHSGIGVVLGDNGAGKSTLLRIVAGILEPDRGTVTLAGHLLSGGGVAARRLLGYVPDTSDPLPDLRGREYLALNAALKDARYNPNVDPLQERLGIEGILHQPLGTLSFGQRKRVLLVAALIGDPPLLVLDEPSNGLSPSGVTEIVTLLRERQEAGRATLLSSNDEPFIRSLGEFGAYSEMFKYTLTLPDT